MMTTTTLSATQILRQIEARQISLTSTYDGKIWSASIERVKDKRRFTRADMEIISATSTTPAGAVVALLEKLEGQPQQQELEEAYW